MPLPVKKIKVSRPCPISGNSDAHEVCLEDRHGKSLRNIISADSGLFYVDPVTFQNTEEFHKTEYRKSYKGVHQPKPKHVYLANEVLENILTKRTKYYLRLSNFFKILRNIPVMISEKVKSRSLSGKEILDRLFKNHSF